jgi:hypothetical protein
MTNEPEAGINGAAPELKTPLQPQQQVQINPVATAQAALAFLARADFKAHEREMFAACELMLNAIARGEVQLAQPATRPVN